MTHSDYSNQSENINFISKYPDVFSGSPIKEKENILKYLTSFKPRYATSAFVFDEIERKTIENLYNGGFEDDGYYWEMTDIYHFAKYDMPLSDEFVLKVMKKYG